jgi:hypothetical protein
MGKPQPDPGRRGLATLWLVRYSRTKGTIIPSTPPNRTDMDACYRFGIVAPDIGRNLRVIVAVLATRCWRS